MSIQHIYYTQASPGYTVSTVSVSTNTSRINDRNFNTPYTVTGASSATKVVYIDRGTSPVSGSLTRTPIQAVCIPMYSGSMTNFGANARICIGQHDVLKAAKQVGQVSGSLTTYLDKNQSMFFIEIPTTYNKRYVKLAFENFTSDPTLTQVMLLRKNVIPKASSINGSEETLIHYSIEATFGEENTICYSNVQQSMREFKKSYPLRNPGQIRIGETIFKDCRGNVYPFIFQAGTTIADMQLCKMTQKEASIVERELNLKEQVFSFVQIYRIKSGYTS